MAGKMCVDCPCDKLVKRVHLGVLLHPVNVNAKVVVNHSDVPVVNSMYCAAACVTREHHVTIYLFNSNHVIPLSNYLIHLTTSNSNCRRGCHGKKRCSCRAIKKICSNLCHPGQSCTNCADLQGSGSTVTTLLTSNTGQNSNWVKCGTIQLKMSHLAILSSKTEWLDDAIITAAQNMLQKQNPFVGGLQDTILSENFQMVPPNSQFIQILNVNRNHWITLSTIGCLSSTINVFDSLKTGKLPDTSLKIIADLMQSVSR